MKSRTWKGFEFAVSDSGCFNMTSHRFTDKGYVRLTLRNQKILAHRHIWEECFGPIPDGLCVCHKCDNPRCINPEHLFLGTQEDNFRDMMRKMRHARGERTRPSKLSASAVNEIRQRYQRGDKKHSMAAMAREFGVSKTTLRHIVIRKNWAWVEPKEAPRGK